ncbi:unnamed protein product, partial [Trypanosoma congolense IL3000]
MMENKIFRFSRTNSAAVSVNFPVVDGFFLVDAVGGGVSFTEGAAVPTRTVVMIQVTKASHHHTTVSKVESLRTRIAKSFTNWTEMESRLSYEIIYVQHAESVALTGRQRCDRGGVADDTGNERFGTTSISSVETGGPDR